MSAPNRSSFEVRVPASTANLGAGFDCFGLALDLYLTVRATTHDDPTAPSTVRSRGVAGTAELPTSPQQNLILRAMQHTASRLDYKLPSVRLAVQNDIPISGGLGSSAAAIVAGISLAFALSGRRFSEDFALRCAAEMEHHTDNVAASLLGGFVVSFLRSDGHIVALRSGWPKDIQIIAVTPKMTLDTSVSRAALPKSVPLADAVYNLQRSALFLAALGSANYDLIWDAMQDRLHQPFRESLIPGLAEALAIPHVDGLVGVALSGAGPTVVALATHNYDVIARYLSDKFAAAGLETTTRILNADDEGILLREKRAVTC
jgi:homoserine kinase